jgi:hypothetical protein
LFSEVIAKDRIAIPQQVVRELVKGKCLAELLSNPLRGRVSGHIEVQNAATIMSQHQKDVKDPKTDRGHREEVDGHQLLGMILQKCAPSLRRRLAAAHHVFADAALTDVDAELKQFTVDAWCSPTGILPTHLADQISDLARNEWSSGLAAPHPPGPEQSKSGAMPGKTVSGLTMASAERQSCQRRDRQIHSRRSAEVNFRRFTADLKHSDLVAQSQVLEVEGGTRLEDRSNRRQGVS